MTLKKTGPLHLLSAVFDGSDWEPPGWDPEHWGILYQRWQADVARRANLTVGCDHWPLRAPWRV